MHTEKSQTTLISAKPARVREAKVEEVEENDEDLFNLSAAQEKKEKEKPQELQMIPLQDFTDCKEIVTQLMKMAKENNCVGTNITVNINVNVNINVFNTDKTPAQLAAEAFRHMDFREVLRCLENPDNTKQIAANMLAKMHADPKRPEMHTIKMRKDLSRKQVSIYSRPTDNSPAEWLPYKYEAALNQLSQHAKSLVKSALCGSINIFDFKFRKEGEKMCVCLPTPIDETYIIVYNYRDDDETGMLDPNLDIILEVRLFQGKLFAIPKDDSEIQQQMNKLTKHIRDKGDLVLKMLKEIKFTDKDIGAFLERTRRPLTMLE